VSRLPTIDRRSVSSLSALECVAIGSAATQKRDNDKIQTRSRPSNTNEHKRSKMTRPRPDTARRLLSTSNSYSCHYCSAASKIPTLRLSSTTPTIFNSRTPPALRNMPQIRHYAQAATAPSPDENIDEPAPRRARNPDGAQYPFPNKKNPSPYEIMHLPTTADPKDIKQRCKSSLSQPKIRSEY
jgi:hypothetical protein